MCKEEFLLKLRERLACLPKEDIEERLTFYSEIIDDRIEEGFSEEEAVLAAGSIEEIVKQTVADTPVSKLAKEKIKAGKSLKAWEIVLIAVGSPVWLSLGIAAVAVIFSLCASVFAVTVSLWSVLASFVACAAAGIFAGALFIVMGSVASGVFMIAGGLFCAGASIFAFFGCKAVTVCMIRLAKKIMPVIKNCFVGRERA